MFAKHLLCAKHVAVKNQNRSLTVSKERQKINKPEVSSHMGFPGGSVVKNLPAVQETWVQSLGQEDPFEKESNPLQYSCLENSCGQKSLVGCKQSMDSESNTTEATKQQQQHGLSQDIRYSSLCTIAGPCFLSILYEFASANP